MERNEDSVSVASLRSTRAIGGRSRQAVHVPSEQVVVSTLEGCAQAAALKGVGRIVCFFGVVVVLIAFLDTVVTLGLLQARTGEFGVWNKIIEGKIDADILIAGSSRARSHYDPRIIQEKTGRSAFNIGLNGFSDRYAGGTSQDVPDAQCEAIYADIQFGPVFLPT